jgi:hypothetical protein
MLPNTSYPAQSNQIKPLLCRSWLQLAQGGRRTPRSALLLHSEFFILPCSRMAGQKHEITKRTQIFWSNNKSYLSYFYAFALIYGGAPNWLRLASFGGWRRDPGPCGRPARLLRQPPIASEKQLHGIASPM